MQRHCYNLLTGLLFLTTSATFGQRQELSISPVGFIYPKNQLIQYERYVASRQSLTVSFSYNDSQRGYAVKAPPRTDRFTTTRGAVGYRYYFHSVFGEDVMLFSGVRAVVDYSAFRLTTDSRYSIPVDSLQAAGFSLAPELLLGGKITISHRLTVSGAVGMQYLFKLFPTRQITQNKAYWDAIYWTNDQEDWQFKRNVVTNFRRGWYPSIQFTVGVLLGKRPQESIAR